MKYIDTYLDYLKYQKRYSEHTILSYRRDLHQFLSFCRTTDGGITTREVSTPIVRKWMVHLLESGQKAPTVNRKLSALKSFYRFMQKESYMVQNPVAALTGPKGEKKLPAFVREDEINTLLDGYDFGKDFTGLRNRLIIEMLYDTGMRRAELIGLQLNDVHPEEKSIKVTGKRNKQRIIPITQELAEKISEYLRERERVFPEGTSRFFVTAKGKPLYPKLVYRVVHHYLGMVTTLSQKSPHILRHTFATHLLNRGADLNAIKEILGHASLSATQVYTHNTFEKLRQVYLKAHPRG